jgi:hypothetical protein
MMMLLCGGRRGMKLYCFGASFMNVEKILENDMLVESYVYVMCFFTWTTTFATSDSINL